MENALKGSFERCLKRMKLKMGLQAYVDTVYGPGAPESNYLYEYLRQSGNIYKNISISPNTGHEEKPHVFF